MDHHNSRTIEQMTLDVNMSNIHKQNKTNQITSCRLLILSDYIRLQEITRANVHEYEQAHYG